MFSFVYSAGLEKTDGCKDLRGNQDLTEGFFLELQKLMKVSLKLVFFFFFIFFFHCVFFSVSSEAG